MKKMFLDIETIPADLKLWKNFEKDLQIKYELKKKKPYKKEEVYLKTALDGTYGRILCLGYLIDPDMDKAEVIEGSEKDILKNFWIKAKECDLFIGHNIMEFDLRFIYKRSVINKVKPTKDLSFARYRNYPIYDTMKEWEKWSMSAISLNELTKILGIKSPKGDLDGSRIYEYYKKGKLKEIFDYCRADVEATQEVFNRMNYINGI